jgi:hypothetical protein
MVAFLPMVAMIAALFGMGAHVLKPRLPQYTFQVKEFPLLRWINGNWKTRIGAGVKLQNDNYVPIDVHALSFDLFYPDWQGTLVHIGQVQDKHQQQTQPQQPQQGQRVVSKPLPTQPDVPPTSTDNHKTSGVARGVVDADTQQQTQHSTTTTKSFHKPPTLWKLLPRAQFETLDEVFMQHFNMGHVSVLSSLSWDIFQKRGLLDIPSGGVIQIKANQKLPLTMSIICENTLDLWTLEMQGVTCELSNIEVGWGDISLASERLRNQVLLASSSSLSSSSSTTQPKKKDSKSKGGSVEDQFSKWMRKVKWEDYSQDDETTTSGAVVVSA